MLQDRYPMANQTGILREATDAQHPPAADPLHTVFLSFVLFLSCQAGSGKEADCCSSMKHTES
jgi:hypothetical protein